MLCISLQVQKRLGYQHLFKTCTTMLTNAEGFALSSNVYQMPIFSYWKNRCQCFFLLILKWQPPRANVI